MKRSYSEKNRLTKRDFQIRTAGPLAPIVNQVQREETAVPTQRRKHVQMGRPLNTKQSVFHHTQRTSLDNSASAENIVNLFHIQPYLMGYNTELSRKNKSPPKGTTTQLQMPKLKPVPKVDPESAGGTTTTSGFRKNYNYFFMPKTKREKKVSEAESRREVAHRQDNLAPVLNCKGVGKQQPAVDDDTVVDNEDAKMLKHAKRYKLGDLEADDSFMLEATIPCERTTACIQKIGGNYSIQNLEHHRPELIVVLSQDFGTISMAGDPRELIYICYNMLLYELIEEEFPLYNTLGLMMQSLESILLRPFDFEVDKVCKKYFSLLKKIVSSAKFNSTVIVQMFYNSFNSIGNQIYMIHPDTLKEYLMYFFPFLRVIIELELEVDKVNETNQKNYVSPIKGFEDLFRINKLRNFLIADENLRSLWVNFFESVYQILTQQNSKKVMASRRIQYVAHWFAVLTEIAKYRSLVDILSRSGMGFYREALIKSVLSQLYVSVKSESITPAVRDSFINIFNNCAKMLQADSQEANNPIDDIEYYTRIYFMFHFEEGQRFVQPDNIELCLVLARFFKSMVEHSAQGSHNTVKRFRVEFSSVVRVYSDCLPHVTKTRGSQGEIEGRRTIQTLLDLLKL